MLRVVLALLLVTVPIVARAGDVPSERGDVVVGAAENGYVEGVALEESRETLWGSSVSAGFFLRDDWLLLAEGLFFSVEQKLADDTFLAGGSVGLRWLFGGANDTPLFLEAGGGLSHSGERVPLRGTHTNFLAHFGIGAVRALSADWQLSGAVRWFHVSNGFREGTDRNPAIDAFGVSVGIQRALLAATRTR